MGTEKNDSCILLISKNMGFECLRTINGIARGTIEAVVTVNDSKDSRSVLGKVREYCAAEGLALYIVDSTNELFDIFERYRPSFAFVCGWYRILPERLLEMPKRGFAGFHFSLLPKYRGGAPVVWAMINGEKETGFSLFKFDSGMDTGLLYAQETVEICEEDHIADVLYKIEQKALLVLAHKYLDMLTGRAPLREQKGEPSYGAQRCLEDGRINWEWPHDRIYNFIRAQSDPYPCAYTICNGVKLHITQVFKADGVYYARPGQVVAIKNGYVVVGAGDSKVLHVKFSDTVGFKPTLSTRF